jgi:hypothetical protein
VSPAENGNAPAHLSECSAEDESSAARQIPKPESAIPIWQIDDLIQFHRTLKAFMSLLGDTTELEDLWMLLQNHFDKFENVMKELSHHGRGGE